MNELQKRVRAEVKGGATVNGERGVKLLDLAGIKFVGQSNPEIVLLRVKGEAFEGRVYIRQNVLPGGQDTYYNVIFKERVGWFYHPKRKFLKVPPAQLTLLLDAVVMGTGDVVES